MRTETAWTFKSSFVIAMLIEHRPLLNLYQKSLIIFSYILKAKYVLELRRWIANLPEKWKIDSLQSFLFISITFTLTRTTLQKILTSNIILHKLEWRHGTRLVFGLRRRSLASISLGGGGRVRLHVGLKNGLSLRILLSLKKQNTCFIWRLAERHEGTWTKLALLIAFSGSKPYILRSFLGNCWLFRDWYVF